MPDEALHHACPVCGAHALQAIPVIHHMICAYVGPEYDFDREGEGYRCPKCRRELRDEARDWEVVGSSAQCPGCHAEFPAPAMLDDCA